MKPCSGSAKRTRTRRDRNATRRGRRDEARARKKTTLCRARLKKWRRKPRWARRRSCASSPTTRSGAGAGRARPMRSMPTTRPSACTSRTSSRTGRGWSGSCGPSSARNKNQAPPRRTPFSPARTASRSTTPFLATTKEMDRRDARKKKASASETVRSVEARCCGTAPSFPRACPPLWRLWLARTPPRRRGKPPTPPTPPPAWRRRSACLAAATTRLWWWRASTSRTSQAPTPPRAWWCSWTARPRPNATGGTRSRPAARASPKGTIRRRCAPRWPSASPPRGARFPGSAPPPPPPPPRAARASPARSPTSRSSTGAPRSSSPPRARASRRALR